MRNTYPLALKEAFVRHYKMFKTRPSFGKCRPKNKNSIPTFLVTCADPTPRNGQVSPAGLTNRRHRINSTVSFSCDTGFHLFGDHSESTCQTTGSWDPHPPTCIGNEINDMMLSV